MIDNHPFYSCYRLRLTARHLLTNCRDENMAAGETSYENLYHQQDCDCQSPGAILQPILQYRSETQSQVSSPPPSYHNIPGTALIHVSSERGAPPSYEEAIDPNDPNAPPPSYDSLFGRVREAHKSSKGVFDFLKNVVILLLGTIGCTIILGVTIIVPISMIVIGSVYLYDCPRGEYIPIYLLVGGGFGVLKQLLHVSTRVRQREEEQEEERLRQSGTQTLLNCFMLGWFLIGSVWVYKVYEPDYDPSAKDGYCNRTLYLFAFWLITSVYIALALVTMCLCVGVASIAFQREV